MAMIKPLGFNENNYVFMLKNGAYKESYGAMEHILDDRAVFTKLEKMDIDYIHPKTGKSVTKIPVIHAVGSRMTATSLKESFDVMVGGKEFEDDDIVDNLERMSYSVNRLYKHLTEGTNNIELKLVPTAVSAGENETVATFELYSGAGAPIHVTGSYSPAGVFRFDKGTEKQLTGIVTADPTLITEVYGPSLAEQFMLGTQ